VVIGDLCAITCTTQTPNQVPDRVAALVEASIADNTRRAYRSDLAHFEACGGRLPAEPSTVASYLAAHAETLSVATLVRRLATISKAHEAGGLPNPCRSEIVRATLRGIKRTRGIAQREAKPLLREELFRVLDAMGDGVKDVRDRALLLVAFAGGFGLRKGATLGGISRRVCFSTRQLTVRPMSESLSRTTRSVSRRLTSVGQPWSFGTS
jgi:site-specific recombinase XerC